MDARPLSTSRRVRLALAGAALALAPLAWLWLRHRGADAGAPAARADAADAVPDLRPRRVRRLHAPDRLRPGLPRLAGLLRQRQPARRARRHPGGAVGDAHRPGDAGKAWVEMVHRYLATAVGVLITVMAAGELGARRRERCRCRPGGRRHAGLGVRARRFRRAHRHAQALPGDRHAHLLGGIGLLALLAVQPKPCARRPLRWPAGAARDCAGVWRCWWLQVALGGWVSTNYAVLACSDFPTCQGSWWPDDGFRPWLHASARPGRAATAASFRSQR